MKALVLICIACLTPIVSFSEGPIDPPGEDTSRPSASIALFLALDAVLEVAPESGIEIQGADSQVVEATESKAAHVVVDLELLVRGERGKRAESDFRTLEKELVKRAGEPRAEPVGYDLFKRTLIRFAAEKDVRVDAEGDGAESQKSIGSHRGIVRIEFALGAIPSYQHRESGVDRESAPQASTDMLAPYIRRIAQDPKVKFGGVKIQPAATLVTSGDRYDAKVAQLNRKGGIQPPPPIDFARISNLLYLLAWIIHQSGSPVRPNGARARKTTEQSGGGPVGPVSICDGSPRSGRRPQADV